jgi:transcriptional regulator with XRE-family HTH domain
MSAEALGAYLIVLREGRGITARAIAESISSTPTHLWRIEQGVTKGVSADLLHRYAHTVRARLEDIHAILLDPAMPKEEGIRLARCLLDSEATPGHNLTAQASAEELDQALRALEQRLSLRQRRQWLRLGVVLLGEPGPDEAGEPPAAPN